MTERRDATIEEIGEAMTQMLAQAGNATSGEVWRLEGWDEFDGHSYALPGEYGSEVEAEAAAREKLAELAVSQSSTDHGFTGLRDRVSIVAPDGTRRRYRVGEVATPKF